MPNIILKFRNLKMNYLIREELLICNKREIDDYKIKSTSLKNNLNK